jgi:hypothetical protein
MRHSRRKLYDTGRYSEFIWIKHIDDNEAGGQDMDFYLAKFRRPLMRELLGPMFVNLKRAERAMDDSF